jgi:tRNA(fMet)-specific endonuclease VapC
VGKRGNTSWFVGTLIDTSVLIDLERSGLPPEELLTAIDEAEELFLSSITVGELLIASESGIDAMQRHKRRKNADKVLATFPCLSIGVEVAEHYARIASALLAKKTPIGVNDTWIAATAMNHSLRVLTGNAKHFERVDGLQVLAWKR